MTCSKCHSTNTKSSRISHALGWITEIVCPECGTTQTIYDHEPGKGQQLQASVVQAPKAETFTMDEVVSFAVATEPTGLVCPQCFGANLERNPGLSRHDASGITHGYICQDCGEAFIEHPDLRQKPTPMSLEAAKNPVQYRKRQKQIDSILDDANRGSGQWLKPRKGKDEGGMFFEVGK